MPWVALLLAAQFVEVGLPAGLTHRHENGASPQKLMMETFGSGVAAFDFDLDGRVDLFFVNGADLARGKTSPGHKLYRNTGGGKFEDVTPRAGVRGNGGFGTGVAAGGALNMSAYARIFSFGRYATSMPSTCGRPRT